MKARIACLCLLLMGGLALVQGCDDEPAEVHTGGSGGTGGEGGSEPELKPPGGACNCDLDCEGDDALCLLGMCVKRAAGPCDPHARELGCDPGLLCFNTDILPGQGTCWPLYDETTCEHVENRHEVCSPVRGTACDPGCGAGCVPDSVPPEAAGAPCEYDYQCASGLEPMCYSESDYAVDRFLDGYCLYFGCAADEECGIDAACAPLASDGSGVCMNTCGMDLDCRPGYVCRSPEDWDRSVCFGGCDEAATCPPGFVCSGGYCIDEALACSPSNPTGLCPDGYFCDDGVCSDEPFVCTADDDDQFEPNETREAATAAPLGDTTGLTICAGDEDWFQITVPANTIVRVGIDFLHVRGDLDLVAYDADGELLGSRMGWIQNGKTYPYHQYRDYEHNTEYYGFYSEAGGDTYYVRVVGYQEPQPDSPQTQNQYNLHVDEFPYVDGPDCEAAGYSTDECRGHGPYGSGLLPFPFPDPNDSVVGDGYFWESLSSARFGRRELIMGIRNALAETMNAFAGTTAIGISDISQIDGETPYTEVDEPHHPGNSHSQGGNIDIAYFQTDGLNDVEIICGDGSVHNDGWCSPAAEQLHIVDLPRQAFFLGKLCVSPRLRCVGVDAVIGPLIRQAADDLMNLPDGDPHKLTPEERNAAHNKIVHGAAGDWNAWPFHHHHMHVSFQWWTNQDVHGPPSPPPSPGAGAAARHSILHPHALRQLDGKVWRLGPGSSRQDTTTSTPQRGPFRSLLIVE
jgi:hypothetical protein